MKKYRAVPQGYMTVGEIAKIMGVTVRTLQYYDKEGVLSPLAKSEGGRRLYTNKDIVKLHQIQSMKYLGFSLEDIKTRLPSINTPQEVADVLSQQAQGIREKISTLTDVLKATEKLKAEVLQMQSVDWEKYAYIIGLLEKKNDLYWAMKHFDDKLITHVRSIDAETQEAIMRAQKQALDKARELQKKGISPESEQGRAFAREFWEVIVHFTKGDMGLLSALAKLGQKQEGQDSAWKEVQKFIEPALAGYFQSLGYNPLEEALADD